MPGGGLPPLPPHRRVRAASSPGPRSACRPAGGRRLSARLEADSRRRACRGFASARSPSCALAHNHERTAVRLFGRLPRACSGVVEHAEPDAAKAAPPTRPQPGTPRVTRFTVAADNGEAMTAAPRRRVRPPLPAPAVSSPRPLRWGVRGHNIVTRKGTEVRPGRPCVGVYAG